MPSQFTSLILIGALTASAPRGITDATQILAEPEMPTLSVGETKPDPVFGSAITRVTDATANGRERLGPEYSQLQVWNSDMSLMLLGGDKVFAADDFKLRHSIDFDPRGYGGAVRWSTTEPDVLFYTWADWSQCDGGALIRYTLPKNLKRAGKREVVRCFTEYRSLDKDRSFEELSVDGRWLGLVGNRRDGKREIFAYDIHNDKKHTPYQAPRPIDWVAISPSGKYMIVLWAGQGIPQHWGMDAYDVEMEYRGKVHTGTGHSDIVMDENGDEWAIVDNSNNAHLLAAFHYIVKARIPNGIILAGDVVDREATVAEGLTVPLLQMDWFVETHVSCRATSNPQWCLITGEGGPAPRQPFQDELFLLSLDSRANKPIVKRIAHHRSSIQTYWDTPFGTLSPDGKYIAFASNWRGTSTMDAYIAEVEPTP